MGLLQEYNGAFLSFGLQSVILNLNLISIPAHNQESNEPFDFQILLMAEIVVGAVITVLCEKLLSGDLMKLARSEGLDSKLKRLTETFPLIQVVLADAGQKQITETPDRKPISLWLNKLEDLAYDIEDVLDDLATEAGLREMKQESHANSKVRKFIPTSWFTNLTPRNIKYGCQMSSKLDKVITRLNDLVKLKNDLGLNVNNDFEKRTERRVEETSVVSVAQLMGREGDKDVLLGMLLGTNNNNEENVSVVSIVGLGGIGKTTIAKDLFNNDKVKDHFELMAWVCVSDVFDVFNISMSIFQKLNGEIKEFNDLNLLHEALQEKVSKRKFLLVLDDVWNQDHTRWEQLKSPLLVGAPGSRILVTTRIENVASVMGSAKNHRLDVLSDEDALSLFAQHALGENNFDKYPWLTPYGERFVKKCDRLPLALKMIGQALKTKGSDGDRWEKLLQNEIWDIEEKLDSKILLALRLSFNELPPELKRPFAYCSLFPKDYVFHKNKIVLLWMAQGFLYKSNCNESLENLDHEYFEKLESRSFFQHSAANELAANDELGYTMHDLINDLATSVAGEFFFRLDDTMDASKRNDETFEKFRHFSLIGPDWKSYMKLKEVFKSTRLRTFLPMSLRCWQENILSDYVYMEKICKLRFLRVLSVKDLTSNTLDLEITKVPQSIGGLKHLRYLNFSYTGISCLPEEVGDLYNLHNLLLRGCFYLSRLPKSFVKLTKLRHFDIHGTESLEKMPLGIGRLTSLQTLPKVIIEGANINNGFKISDLSGLPDIQSELSIMGLDKVKSPLQAKDVNLPERKRLVVLDMEWTCKFDGSRNQVIEYEVLEQLRPHHHKLRNLKISFYMGMRFPCWVGDPSFYQLTELALSGCKITQLPTLGHLPALKELFVEGMNEVENVGFEFIAPTFGDNIVFPSLEVLEFYRMEGWQRWSTTDANGIARSFPRLREIAIGDCPKLTQVSVGFMPSVRVLYIETCSEAVLRSVVGVCSSVVELKLKDVRGLTRLHGEDLMHLGALEHLAFYNCNELRYLWKAQSDADNILSRLQTLKVCYCDNLVSLGEKEANDGVSLESLKEVELFSCDMLESFSCPNSVEKLVIERCNSLASFTLLTTTVLQEPSSSFGYQLPLFSLRKVIIQRCQNLNSFPHEHFQSLTCLEKLLIYQCPSMESFPCGLWPPNLRELKLRCLNKPVSEWDPQNFPSSVVELAVDGKTLRSSRRGLLS